MASGVYQCPGRGERLAGERRCQECNLFARRLGEAGCCPACSEVITIHLPLGRECRASRPPHPPKSS